MNLNDLVQQAKRILIRDHPELTWILFEFNIKLDPSLSFHAQVDVFEKEITLNPTLIKEASEKYKMSLLATYQYFIWHELKHVLLKHHKRGMEIKADPILWNVACDVVVEYTNLQEGITTDIGYSVYCGFLNILSQIKVITAEAIYYYLLKNARFSGYKSKDNIILHQETDDELEILLDNTLRTYIKSVGNEKLDSIEEYQIILTKLNILKYIQNVVALNLMRAEPSIKIPHRRQIALGINTLWEQIKLSKQRKILIAVDTSGSISSEEFSIFMSGVLNACKEVSTDLILWDVVINSEYRDITEKDILTKNIKFKGRGGTNLNCVIDFLDKNPYSNCIILTDGYCNFDKRKWDLLKYKPQITLFYTHAITFTYPNAWDIHFLDVKRLMVEAVKIKGGLS